MSSPGLPRAHLAGCSKFLSPPPGGPIGPFCPSLLGGPGGLQARGSLHPRRPWWPSLTCRPYGDKTGLKESHKK